MPTTVTARGSAVVIASTTPDEPTPVANESTEPTTAASARPSPTMHSQELALDPSVVRSFVLPAELRSGNEVNDFDA